MPTSKIEKDAKELKGVGKKRLEKYWSRAKKQAEKQGHKNDWPYIMGIYKNLTKQYKKNLKESSVPVKDPADHMPGGTADGKSVSNIAFRFGISIPRAESAIARGAKVEYEHTKNLDLAREIAKDHIWETPVERGIDYYYNSLEQIEEKDTTMQDATADKDLEEQRQELRQFIMERAHTFDIEKGVLPGDDLPLGMEIEKRPGYKLVRQPETLAGRTLKSQAATDKTYIPKKLISFSKGAY